jgi:prolyl 4-hydroxylase
MFNIFNKKGKNYSYLEHFNIPANDLSICIKGVFNTIECDELIKKSEIIGYKKASLYEKNGVEHFHTDIRDSLRCIIDDPEFALILEQRLSHFIPKEYKGKKYHSINPRFRFLKYNDKSHHFKPHTDGHYSTNTTISMITILIYLNEDYTGARTTIKTNEIVPEVGLVYLMDQNILHFVPNLIDGIKYVIRTEIMYLK